MSTDTIWALSLLHPLSLDGSTIVLSDEDGEKVTVSFENQDTAETFWSTLTAISRERGPWNATLELHAVASED